MKSENNIKKFFGKAAIDTNPEKDKKVLNKIIAAQTKASIWRLIMESPVTKLAAAAVFIAGIFILFVYSSDGHDSLQKNEPFVITPNNNNEQLPIENKKLENDLLLANELYENNDISGLSELLNNEFREVRFQAAEFLGQIGDETVITQLQMLADKWEGLEEKNVFENAILNINNRQHESETNNIQEEQNNYNEPKEPVTETNDIQNRTLNNTSQDEIRRLLLSSTSPDHQDNEDEVTREPENILFGAVLDERGNPVSGAQVFASYAESGITNSEGKFELQVPRTDGGGSIGDADFPIYVWAFKKDEPYKVAWTLIRDTELEPGQDIEQTHQGVELTIRDEEELFEKIPGIPGELSYNEKHNLIVKDIVLIMEPANVISGHVKGIDGQPVEGALVRAKALVMGIGPNILLVSDFESEWKPGPECITDSSGYYTLNNIPACWLEALLVVTTTQPYNAEYAEYISKSSENTIKNIQLTEEDLDIQNNAENMPNEIENHSDATTIGFPLRGGSNANPVIVQDYLKNNLILSYSFYDYSNLSDVIDSSGKKNHGQVEGASYQLDETLGGIMYFDGDNDYISLPTLSLNKYTFGAWIKPTAPDLNNRRVFLLDSGETYCSIEGNSRGGISANVANGFGMSEYEQTLEKNQWVYITVTYDNETLKIYLNGQLTESGKTAYSGGITGKAYIGFSGNFKNEQRHNGEFWKGYIDEIVLLNRALTEDEVQQLFLMTGTYVKQ